nr:hypothetical protein [Acidobacteriota bacterium]
MPSFRVSSSFARSIAFTLCLVLIVSGLAFPAGTQITQAQSPGLRRQLPPHYALPRINDLLTEGRKLHRPDLPRPALKPSTLCGHRDVACKAKQAKERRIGLNLNSSDDKTANQATSQLGANSSQKQGRTWLTRFGQFASRLWNGSPFGLSSALATEASLFFASSTVQN